MQAWKNKGGGQRRRGKKDTGFFPESPSCLRKPWTWQLHYGSSGTTMGKHLRGNKKTLFQIGAQNQLPNPYPAAEYCKATANTWASASPTSTWTFSTPRWPWLGEGSNDITLWVVFLGVFFDAIFEVSLENEHPLLIPVTHVPGYYRLQRQLCIPSVSEAIPKLANICTTTHPVSSAATKNMHVSGNVMHFIASASHAITKQYMPQLYPSILSPEM